MRSAKKEGTGKHSAVENTKRRHVDGQNFPEQQVQVRERLDRVHFVLHPIIDIEASAKDFWVRANGHHDTCPICALDLINDSRVLLHEF